MRNSAKICTMLLLLVACQGASAPEFPAAFWGQWTEDLAACGGEDTSGLFISSRNLDYYDGQGVLIDLAQESASAVSAQLEFTGEGETWRETARLELSEDKQSMSAAVLAQTLTLSRCSENDPS
jgi:hypothetical protein